MQKGKSNMTHGLSLNPKQHNKWVCVMPINSNPTCDGTRSAFQVNFWIYDVILRVPAITGVAIWRGNHSNMWLPWPCCYKLIIFLFHSFFFLNLNKGHWSIIIGTFKCYKSTTRPAEHCLLLFHLLFKLNWKRGNIHNIWLIRIEMWKLR